MLQYWLLHVDKLTDDRLNVLEIPDFLEEFGHLGCRRRVCVTSQPHGGPVRDLHGHPLHATSAAHLVPWSTDGVSMTLIC